jgi:membrane protein
MKFLKDLYGGIEEDTVFSGAAALAYYWMLAIFPAAIFLLSLLPFLPIPDLQQSLTDVVRQAIPGQASQLLLGVITDVTSNRRGGMLSFGLLFTLWSASTGLYALMQQLNITYNVKETRNFLELRATAILLMLLCFILIVGAFALIVFGGKLQGLIASVFDNRILYAAFAVLRWVIIVACILVAFAVIYHYGPNVRKRFRVLSSGSVAGTVLLIAGSLGFQYYVSRFSNFSATYGALGAVIILLLWLYLTGLVILIGSEINVLLEPYHPEGSSTRARA